MLADTKRLACCHRSKHGSWFNKLAELIRASRLGRPELRWKCTYSDLPECGVCSSKGSAMKPYLLKGHERPLNFLK